MRVSPRDVEARVAVKGLAPDYLIRRHTETMSDPHSSLSCFSAWPAARSCHLRGPGGRSFWRVRKVGQKDGDVGGCMEECRGEEVR